MRIVLPFVAVAVLVAGGCAPDPLTLQERLHVMVHMNKQLQLELLQRDRLIAQKLGGEAEIPSAVEAPSLSAESGGPQDPFRPVRITLGKVTGGIDTDGQSGDEGVRLLIEPRDKFDHKVKRAGALEIDLFDLALEGREQRIAQWEFTVDQAAREYVSGMLGIEGYSLELPWPEGTVPEHEKLTILVNLTTLDGRTLSAQKDIRVELPPTGSSDATGAGD